MEDFINQKISEGATKISDNAIENIARRLPDDDAKKDFIARMKNISAEGIDAAINGREYQNCLERGAYETSVFLANHYADAALNRVCKELPQGKTRQVVTDALQEMSRRGIESLCSGNSLDAVKAELSEIAQSHFKNYVSEQVKIFSKNTSNEIYKKIKFSGRGSRSKNKNLREGTDLLADEFTFQVTDNLGDVLAGKKSFGDAATDIIVDGGANVVVRYTKKQSEEWVKDTINEVSKHFEKEIKNKFLRDTATSALGKLANSNALMKTTGLIVDIGKDFMRMLDGEISGKEFVISFVERGMEFVVEGVGKIAEGIGKAFGGPMAGAALSHAVKYVVSNLLNSSIGKILKSFKEAEISRKRYEMIHAFCEESIKEMEIQRQEFERNVAQFLSNRQQVIDRSLKDFEASMQMDDMTGVSAALNEIAMEFGGELQFKNRDEFDKFMLDKDSVFVL